ncbi:zinc carboxypeptidase domain-containing protein [Ditylenchus destructor]|uniref:Zinc carboxypeptidase domain-containing protein n=1 Tax=Ditylenchus destructor TaxID=166010 RepID=A0AAD4R3L6_9BILA|nr:zinc carboxypeptidase domain-containing protein [Ditylenchus destructor]
MGKFEKFKSPAKGYFMLLFIFSTQAFEGRAYGEGGNPEQNSKWNGIKKTGEQYSLLSVVIKDAAHAKFLNSAERDHGIRLDLWGVKGLQTNRSVSHAEVLVPAKDAARLSTLLQERKIEHYVKNSDIHNVISAEREKLDQRSVFNLTEDPSSFTLTEYHSYDEISLYLHSVAHKHPSFISNITIGISSEGRPIVGVKIGLKNCGKKKAFINGCVHAREWIACASLIYAINEIVTSPKKYSFLLDNYDIYIVPVLNPDGYVYTWSNETDGGDARLWRKTRSGPRSGCYGVDANRNFDFEFGKEEGDNHDPCTSNYPGPKAFSEPEAKAVADFLETHKDTMFVYMDIHAYSQKLIFPYGVNGKKLQNEGKVRDVAEKAVKAIHSHNYGHTYEAGSVTEIMYKASGLAIDYAMGKLNISFAYAMELRPSFNSDETDGAGFLLPQEQIIPASQECWIGIQEVLREALNHTSPVAIVCKTVILISLLLHELSKFTL